MQNNVLYLCLYGRDSIIIIATTTTMFFIEIMTIVINFFFVTLMSILKFIKHFMYLRILCTTYYVINYSKAREKSK